MNEMPLDVNSDWITPMRFMTVNMVAWLSQMTGSMIMREYMKRGYFFNTSSTTELTLLVITWGKKSTGKIITPLSSVWPLSLYHRLKDKTLRIGQNIGGK